MSKAVLLSVQPKWCELIASGKKTVEVRKTKPKLETPFKVYIYCTLQGSNEFFKENCNGNIAQWNKTKMAFKKGKIIGEFVCDKFDEFTPTEKGVMFKRFSALYEACLSVEEIKAYLGGKIGYGWHISELVIYDEPKELSEFRKHCNYDLGCKCCSMYFPGTMFAEPYCKNGNLEITRPPQSWCYVEKLSE